MAIQEKALLVDLSIRNWQAKAVDKKVTREVHERHHVDDTAGNYTKTLIAKESLAKINAAAAYARQVVYSNTLPWQHGAAIFSIKAYESFSKELREAHDNFDEAVQEFVENYPEYRENARQKLNGLFDENDYPPTDQIRSKFRFNVKFFPVPSGEDLRVNLATETTEEIRRQIEDSINESLSVAVSEVYSKVAKVVEHMLGKLQAYKPSNGEGKAQGVFRDSLVQNVRDLAETLPILNITDDPEIDRLSRRLINDLCDLEPEELRESTEERAFVAKKAEKILEDISAFIN